MKLTPEDIRRDERNLRPHAEARLAMCLWGDEYAAQNGGSMDFWDALSSGRKVLCCNLLNTVLGAMERNGRATEHLGREALANKGSDK